MPGNVETASARGIFLFVEMVWTSLGSAMWMNCSQSVDEARGTGQGRVRLTCCGRSELDVPDEDLAVGRCSKHHRRRRARTRRQPLDMSEGGDRRDRGRVTRQGRGQRPLENTASRPGRGRRGELRHFALGSRAAYGSLTSPSCPARFQRMTFPAVSPETKARSPLVFVKGRNETETTSARCPGRT